MRINFVGKNNHNKTYSMMFKKNLTNRCIYLPEYMDLLKEELIGKRNSDRKENGNCILHLDNTDTNLLINFDTEYLLLVKVIDLDFSLCDTG